MCSDPAHDDLALDDEWSSEERDREGDGPRRDGSSIREVQDVQDNLFGFSGARAPEILRV